MVQGDCESRNAGTQNGMRNGSTKVKFSVRGAPQYIKLVLIKFCVCELQKLAIVAMKSLSI